MKIKYEYLNSVVNIQAKQIDLLNERFNIQSGMVRRQQEAIDDFYEMLKGDQEQ